MKHSRTHTADIVATVLRHQMDLPGKVYAYGAKDRIVTHMMALGPLSDRAYCDAMEEAFIAERLEPDYRLGMLPGWMNWSSLMASGACLP